MLLLELGIVDSCSSSSRKDFFIERKQQPIQAGQTHPSNLRKLEMS